MSYFAHLQLMVSWFLKPQMLQDLRWPTCIVFQGRPLTFQPTPPWLPWRCIGWYVVVRRFCFDAAFWFSLSLSFTICTCLFINPTSDRDPNLLRCTPSLVYMFSSLSPFPFMKYWWQSIIAAPVSWQISLTPLLNWVTSASRRGQMVQIWTLHCFACRVWVTSFSWRYDVWGSFPLLTSFPRHV